MTPETTGETTGTPTRGTPRVPVERKVPLGQRHRARTRERQRADRAARWFGRHRASYRVLVGPGDLAGPGAQRVEALTWAEPGTRRHRLDFLCDGPHLIVTGDLDDAVYEAGLDGLADWAGCDLDYVHRKCIASHRGARPHDWDERQAVAEVRFQLAEHFGEGEAAILRRRYDAGRGAWVTENARAETPRWEFRERGGYAALHTREAFGEWLRDTHWELGGQNGPEVFGDDYYEWAFGAGDVVAEFVHWHWWSLRAAVAQLRAEGTALFRPDRPGGR